MDPNLFYLNLERLTEVIIAIIFLSMIVERALAQLFETRLFIEKTESGKIVAQMIKDPEKFPKGLLKQKKKKGLKESIALVASIGVCWLIHFDALTISFASNDHTTIYGYIITGLIVAGGSKASIKLFKDWIGIMSRAQRDLEDIKNSKNK
jgi:hypothetical protein